MNIYFMFASITKNQVPADDASNYHARCQEVRSGQPGALCTDLVVYPAAVYHPSIQKKKPQSLRRRDIHCG